MRKNLRWRRRHFLPPSLILEPLEDRLLLSGMNPPWNSPQVPPAPATSAASTPLVQSGHALQTNLVSDGRVPALYSDTYLLNPWGIALGPTGDFWISDNATGLATLYDSAGRKLSLEVRIPTPWGVSGVATPTGQVYNGTPGFALAPGEPAMFLFATEDGTISGWNAAVDANNAVLMVDNSAWGAIYKGLALGTSSAGNVLYAANFHAGTIDAFDANFQPIQLPGSFTDPNIPAGFAPFNVENLGGRIYVTYAEQLLPAKYDSQTGPGYGFVDVFDTDGNLIRRIASGDPGNVGSPLNSPWGLALAPANFGAFSNDLLVGNFGDGHISVYDPNASDRFLGQLSRDNSGDPVVIDGLWGLTFGNGQGGTQSNTLYFTAGTNGGTDGLFGQQAYQLPASSQGTGESGTPSSAQASSSAATSNQQSAAAMSSTAAQPYPVSGSNQNTAADGTVETGEQPYSGSNASEYSPSSYGDPASGQAANAQSGYAAATSNQDTTSSTVTAAQQPMIQAVAAAVLAFLKASEPAALTGPAAVAASATGQAAVLAGAVEQSVAAASQRVVGNHAAPMVVKVEAPAQDSGTIMRPPLTAVENHGTGKVVDAQAPVEAQAGTSMQAEPQVFDLLTGVLPFDVASAERSVQSFFERLESLNEPWDSQLGTRLAPWVVAVTAATVAFETARRQMRKQPLHMYEWASSRNKKALTWVPDLGDPPLLDEP